MAALLCVCLAVSLAVFLNLSNEPADAAAASDVDSPDSSIIVVNKDRPLAAEYVPQDLVDAGGMLLRAEAAGAYTRMVADAAADGVAVSAVSGYRSREEQSRLHTSYIADYGQEGADSLSARPGYSEHETGLAVDIGNPDGLCALETCFEGTAAGSWAAANAHRYGFLIRYPAGAEHITGYAYEPWHLRYVGPETARGVRDAGVTLEEFLGLPAAPGY
ncbi:M15 family metallopeptidase [Arthrobacter sp. zg-Y769]|uniref:M15 family metallopeptidase n=1 Tax=Arthrobacter sp. zg-Y769 TaxID=2894191 RepID=UPI001E617B35|nr:M15 family metallopeptidase [Arthrobacter sp. zg-Y769]MCC9204551.1 M15 family metallopeptidase [Arthrobacter sp. zg-Y769]